ncbi:MotA/TolQ/ExbB proton channel family protein [Vibrio ostreicida]|uniref:MotA/TolQ/ExbB proton channel family protein n=1 Tax=Vibrio ostreicida TaxID=526588 RepID=A0ABT8BS14_9VIBR|nr:MotA/TolQ/ExbB proton channel family protein [Vibrio ostreicida]MDN3609885.1 MotA/TolQ/ExbB proton channel family protein [Vibrio ostreicida]NPD10005.1 flagellar motor protein MotA [Vibrio ostreicida]
MKFNMIISLIVLCSIGTTNALADLVDKAQLENKQQAQHNLKREARFQQTESQLKQRKSQLLRQRSALQKQNDKLVGQFGDNEDKLARLEEKLRLESGSLGEVFGVVRQNAKELQSELENSVTSADKQTYTQTVKEIAAASQLPSMAQLKGLWLALEEQIQASGEFVTIPIRFVDGEGISHDKTAVRLGSIGLVGEDGYLRWLAKKGEAQTYKQQPRQAPTQLSLSALSSGQEQHIVLDPSRGILLAQLEERPTLFERLQAGGLVGKIILGLMSIGLIIALIRGVSLLIARKKIHAQLKVPQTPTDNPLGRVLAVYSKENKLNVEALELRLLEAIVDEQSGLEKGLSMLKLLAALAPMLGLLGTVTGMIETFQVITQFGNSDPKVMAGGISMALVTTVLGLIAAMPLLLAHNILSSQAAAIRAILEKQSISLVAAQAERDIQANQGPQESAA